jgi:hypothetical protein
MGTAGRGSIQQDSATGTCSETRRCGDDLSGLRRVAGGESGHFRRTTVLPTIATRDSRTLPQTECHSRYLPGGVRVSLTKSGSSLLGGTFNVREVLCGKLSSPHCFTGEDNG